MNKVILNGITWSHSRGYTPLAAAAQRFNELYPEVEVIWKKRSLQEFADFPLEKLTAIYDLLIIDHPWVGAAAVSQSILPLDEYLPAAFFRDQFEYSVGNSHLSYHFNEHQWALAIDAASPVASYRKDLMERNDLQVPATWAELISLAQQRKVAVPGIAIDLLMNFYMFCLAHGNEPFRNQEELIDQDTGLLALETMKELWSAVEPKMFDLNPIAIAELMTSSDNYYYCPFAYGYSNYSRTGYARKVLHYTDLVTFNPGLKLRSTLGGTGIAVSSSSTNREWALKFAKWISSPEIQSGLYAANGGQPGHRSAWLSPEVNSYSRNYFLNTLPALDRSYVRPRYHGYLYFQDRAGELIRQYLQKSGNPVALLKSLNLLYQNPIL